MIEKKPKPDLNKWPARCLLPTLICFSLLLCSCGLQQRAIKIEVPDAQRYTICLINGRIWSITTHTQSHEHGQVVTIEQRDEYKKGLLRTRKVSSVTEIIQDSDGTVLRFEDEKHRGIRNDHGGFDIYSVNRNKKIQEIPISKETLFELQMPNWLEKHSPQEGDTLTIAIFSPFLLEETQYSIAVGPMKKVSILGQIDELRHLDIEASSSIGRIRCERYVNEQWEPIKERFRVGGLVVESYRCTREQIPETIAPVTINELAAVESPVRIRNMAGANRIRYLIKPKDGSEFDFPATDYQKIIDRPDGSIILEVLPMNPPRGHTFPYGGNDPEILNALKATSVLECNDEIILKLAKKAVGKQEDAAKAVEKIRSFVLWHLRTGYTDAYSAVEIATARKGKCLELAILMAAMCRSVGIPSNVVTGYVYVGRKHNIKRAFSGHAWVEAYVGEKWYAVDPTRLTMWGFLNDHTVGHIATYIWEGGKDEIMELVSGTGTFEIVSVQQY